MPLNSSCFYVAEYFGISVGDQTRLFTTIGVLPPNFCDKLKFVSRAIVSLHGIENMSLYEIVFDWAYDTILILTPNDDEYFFLRGVDISI